MKIMYLLGTSRFSGAENVVCQIIEMMREFSQIEMVYVSRDGQISQALDERNIKFVPISSLSFKEVSRVIKELKPDIIHAQDMRASFVASIVCGKISLISHIHNNNFDSRCLSVKAISYLYAGLKAKHIFWVSQSSFEGYAFHNLLKKKSTVLYNIIDIDALYRKMQLDKNTYEYDVVYIGRLTYQKNPERLMRVFKLLVDKLPNVKIAVVGTGDLEIKIKKIAQEYKLQNNVTFLGFQSNPLKILYDSKVMIMTSRWEGTPMSALEAMALGVPIVSTPVDGMKDLIHSGENGYLSDIDEDLVENVYEIICNHNLRMQFSNYNKSSARKMMDLNSYREKILNSYIRNEGKKSG